MFNLVEKRRWYFIFSALVIIPGLLIMIYSTVTTGAPFRLGIDFTGGAIYDLVFDIESANDTAIREVFSTVGDENVILQRLGQEHWVIEGLTLDEATTDTLGTIFTDITERVDVRSDANTYLLTFDNTEVTAEDIQAIIAESFETEVTASHVSMWSVRASYQDSEGLQQLEQNLAGMNGRMFGERQTVSETIGREVTRAAFAAVGAAALVITGFIVIAFRQVPNALRYGVSAIVAMVHDVLVVMGVMSLMGLLFGWEIDTLFLTAVLTVVGFSVQDSIVVFDRIRENIPLRLGEPYETIVNRSLWETIHRSLATQLNAFFIMIAILLFGGETVRQFIFILFVGLLSGSYSSLFTAVPLLVSWEKGEIPFVNQDSALQEA